MRPDQCPDKPPPYYVSCRCKHCRQSAKERRLWRKATRQRWRRFIERGEA